MAIPILGASKINSATLAVPKIIAADLRVFAPEYMPTLYESLASCLIPASTQEENVFRAGELHSNLYAKFLTLRTGSILSEFDIDKFNKVLNKLEKIKNKKTRSSINAKDAEILLELISRLEVLQEDKDKRLKAANSLDSVINTISDKIMNILFQEALMRGSYINLALSLARLNPLLEIPDENELREYLKSKVLTKEFKTCLLDSIKGDKSGRSKLTPLQKQFFFFANMMIWIIAHMPEFAVKYVPRLGKVTRLSVNLIEQIPIAGTFINKFFVPVDEAVRIIERHPEEIRTLRKEAKQVKLLSKILDTMNKLGTEGLSILQKLFQ